MALLTRRETEARPEKVQLWGDATKRERSILRIETDKQGTQDFPLYGAPARSKTFSHGLSGSAEAFQRSHVHFRQVRTYFHILRFNQCDSFVPP